MRTFILLWFGQLVSLVGSRMTYFALTLWVWQQMESVTAIALIFFFFQLPQIAIALFSGILVDAIPRRRLLIVSDLAIACCTLVIGLLSAAQSLQLWHLYLIAAIYGCFGHLQDLTYVTTIPLIVPKQHHTRAVSMGAIVVSGSAIVSPALAGLFYPTIGLPGITAIDLVTFAIAIFTLLRLHIPQAAKAVRGTNPQLKSQPGINLKRKWRQEIWQNASLGFRYIGSHRSLLTMVITLSSFAFLNKIGETLYQPLILARTGGNTQILGTVVAAAGLGGVFGGLVLSIWKGFRQRTTGILFGVIGTGLSQLMLGLGHVPAIWTVAQFGSAFHWPLIASSYKAVWYDKVAPELQGRVFAADYWIGLVIEASASLIAGPLADRIFEPVMQSGNWFATLLSPLLGATAGKGIGLFYSLNALCIFALGIFGFAQQHFRNAETCRPNYEPISDSLQD